MKDSAQLFGAPSPEASKFAIDMFNFEKRIAEITPDSEYMNNPVKINNKMKVCRCIYYLFTFIYGQYNILGCFDFLHQQND